MFLKNRRKLNGTSHPVWMCECDAAHIQRKQSFEMATNEIATRDLAAFFNIFDLISNGLLLHFFTQNDVSLFSYRICVCAEHDQWKFYANGYL